MDWLGSMKELYSATLKATYPIEIGDKTFLEGEIVSRFDRLSIAALDAKTSYVSANGGYDNRGHVFWESQKEAVVAFSQGVFSSQQLALLTNSKLVNCENERFLLSKTEILESNERKTFNLKETPVDQLFVYNLNTGDKINYTLSGKVVTIDTPFTNVIVDYNYYYENGGRVIRFGDRLCNGYFEFEGRTRVKDDTTGQVVTGIIKIPKLKLMSNLSIHLGKNATPMVANFQGLAVPAGSRGNSYISEFFCLENDVDSDI